MPEGIVKRKTDRGFGFIRGDSGEELFFHCSAVEETTFTALQEGDRVSYLVGQGPKGPRAESVKPK